MPQLTVDIYISADEYLKHYESSGRFVYCQSREGLSVKFSAGVLQRFVTREGIRGSFVIEFDHNMKFKSINRL